MARRCKTALVEPPRAITMEIAFSNAFLVNSFRGVRFWLIKFKRASPASMQSSFLEDETASFAELLGRLSPKASIADAIVLAVYIPPHAPGPGMAFDSISRSSMSEILPSECAPTASKTEITSVLSFPGWILPP